MQLRPERGRTLPLPGMELHYEIQGSGDARIANARGIHATHMGEFALAMMLAFEKRIPMWLEEQRQRRWEYHGIWTLRGKTVVILGLGSIGLEVARLCRAFGMRVLGTRRGGAAAEDVDRVAKPSETAELF